MALQDPVAIYNADDNFDAVLVRDLLQDAGVEAFAVEDVSQAGTWMLGSLPEIHKPQVWVDRSNVERAEALIQEHKDRQPQEGAPGQQGEFCYQCGEAVSRGTSTCPACGKTLDWSDERPMKSDLWAEDPDDETNEDAPTGMDYFKAIKKPVAWFMLGPVFVMFLGMGLAIVYGIVRLFAR